MFPPKEGRPTLPLECKLPEGGNPVTLVQHCVPKPGGVFDPAEVLSKY